MWALARCGGQEAWNVAFGTCLSSPFRVRGLPTSHLASTIVTELNAREPDVVGGLGSERDRCGVSVVALIGSSSASAAVSGVLAPESLAEQSGPGSQERSSGQLSRERLRAGVLRSVAAAGILSVVACCAGCARDQIPTPNTSGPRATTPATSGIGASETAFTSCSADVSNVDWSRYEAGRIDFLRELGRCQELAQNPSFLSMELQVGLLPGFGRKLFDVDAAEPENGSLPAATHMSTIEFAVSMNGCISARPAGTAYLRISFRPDAAELLSTLADAIRTSASPGPSLPAEPDAVLGTTRSGECSTAFAVDVHLGLVVVVASPTSDEALRQAERALTG